MINTELNAEDIFSDVKLFERYILDVRSDSDRKDIMLILSDRIIRILLREEFDFLYMKSLHDFKFSLIINILFREFTNEWISYAEEKLFFSHDNAIEFMQDKDRVIFLLSIVKTYFKKYKLYFVHTISDTFIELIDSMPQSSVENELIQDVLESDFVKRGRVSMIYNYSQLWSRVKSAHNVKNEELSRIQIKLYEAIEKKEEKKINKLEYEMELLEQKPLAYFDESIMRVRNTMSEYMLEI